LIAQELIDQISVGRVNFDAVEAGGQGFPAACA
jgi:hypothetical protein